MTKTLDIMVDIDEPLFPWAMTVHEACREAGLHDLPSWSSWHMWEDYGCDKDLWLEVVARATHAGMYSTTAPVPNAAEALRMLHFEGHRIHLVTARGYQAFADQIREWTRDWVEEFAIPHKTLTFATDKVAAMIALGVTFDIGIDDGVHNYEALDAVGVDIRLLDQPHNQQLQGARRVYSMDHFVREAMVKAHG